MITVDDKVLPLLVELSDTYREKNILITGASGMIGQNVVALLVTMNDKLKTNIHIVAHGRNKDKMQAVFSEYSKRDDIEYIEQDVRELSYNGHVDYIIHTANVTGGSEQHLKFPMRTISTALESAKRVLDMAVKNNASTIFLSSLEIYGYTGERAKDIYESDGGYVDCTSVRSSYSESKRMCECMYASYSKQYGVAAYIARLTATFGWGVSLSDKRVFAQFAKSIIAHEDIVLKSTGESIRDYCDAMDAAVALLIIMAKGLAGQAYNVANMSTIISIKDMARRFIELYPESGSNLVFDLGQDATSLGYNAVMRNVINSDKLMSLGWFPMYGLDDMICHLIDAMSNGVALGSIYRSGPSDF